MAEAGWYPDPQDAQSLQYFDGQNWTGTRRPATDAASGGSGPAAEATTQNPRWAPTQPQWNPGNQPTQQNRPAWQSPQQPPQQPPQQQQPAQQPPYGGGWAGQQGAPGVPPQWGGPPQKTRSKKLPLVIGAVVVVAAVVAVLGFVVFGGGDDAPSITYQGKALANGAETLTKTEASLADVVKQRHGASNADTRCYYVQAAQPESGQKKSDIQSSLRCGPVLFVDGTKDAEYVAVSVSGTVSGDKATLTAQDVADDVSPAKLDQGIKLIRPDGKAAPDGDGGLSAPAPPAADKSVLTVASLGSATKPQDLSGAVMVGLTTRVTLDAAGYVTRYGSGDDARSAPSGQRLIAFQLEYGPGEGSGTGAVRATLVGDGAPRTLPITSGSDQWIVTAVTNGSQPLLRLVDGGVTQTLSLPDGKPGAGNVQVLLRQHTTNVLTEQFTVPVRVSDSSGSVNVTLSAKATSAELSFWPPGHETVHASRGDKALLFVRLNYTDKFDKGQTFGFDPALLRLRLPTGQIVAARNIANEANKLYNVFEVPADFTTGQMQITGSERVGGSRLTVAAARAFTVTIPAG